MKIKCPYCEKIVKAKIIATWKRKHKERTTQAIYFPDDDGDDIEAKFPIVTVTMNYKRIVVLEHNRGLIRKTKCRGSDKRMIKSSKFVPRL